MARTDELRLMTKVARLYYEQGLRQADIAAQLHLSQATTSRLLKRAQAENIVRITVRVPREIHTELEGELETIYGLQDAIVADCEAEDEGSILRSIGGAAAFYVEHTLATNEVIGISSWSETLLSMVDAMHPLNRSTQAHVVQILGGIGNPVAETHASRLVTRLATLVRGNAAPLPAPGVVGSAESLRVLLDDTFVHEAMRMFDQVTLALVGIGSIEPSKLLASSGNVFASEELERLRSHGAVGDVLLRFFNSDGKPVATELDHRVIGMSLEQLQKVSRIVGMAGGKRKTAAIRGCLRGGLINVLITDRFTAERLVQA